jgi:hypothetical protein
LNIWSKLELVGPGPASECIGGAAERHAAKQSEEKQSETHPFEAIVGIEPTREEEDSRRDGKGRLQREHG